MRVTSDAWSRVRAMREHLIARGAESLPEPYRTRVRAAISDAAGRHKSLGMSEVVALALDALESVISLRPKP